MPIGHLARMGLRIAARLQRENAEVQAAMLALAAFASASATLAKMASVVMNALSRKVQQVPLGWRTKIDVMLPL